jgi:uncharacterized protein YjiK
MFDDHLRAAGAAKPVPATSHGPRPSWTVALVAGVLVGLGTASAQAADPFDYQPASTQREIHTSELGVERPVGLSYDVVTRALFLVGEGQQQMVGLTLEGDPAGFVDVSALSDPLLVTRDAIGQVVLLIDNELIRVEGLGTPSESLLSLALLDVVAPAGLSADTHTGDLYVLDASAPRILQIAPTGEVREIALDVLATRSLRGIAHDPASGLLYLASPEDRAVWAVDLDGALQASFDLTDVDLLDPQAIVFAPTGDPTDDPRETNLYVADPGIDGGSGAGDLLLEVALGVAAPSPTTMTLSVAAEGAPTLVAALVNQVALSQLSPPSPDSAGITYIANRNRLLVSDSEVNEMPIFEGANLFELTLEGGLVDTGDTTGFSREPTGLSYNPANGHLFSTNDDRDAVYEVDPGLDGRYGTSDDDVVAQIDTGAFGSSDPEGVAYDTTSGDLFVVDGAGREVYRVSPGANGVFDGGPSGGDDVVDHFDVGVHGAGDPEGIAYNAVDDTLLVLDRKTRTVYETSRGGGLVRLIDISAANAILPAGVVLAPASSDPAQSNLYIVDRGVDNNKDREENDGMLYEMSVDFGPTPNLPPLADAGPDQVVLGDPGTTATLDGSASDDDGGIGNLSVAWQQIGGPATATLLDSAAAVTGVDLPMGGDYSFELTVTDVEGRSDTDQVVVTVQGVGGPFSLAISVLPGSDDSEERATGSVSTHSSDLEMTFDGSQQTVGLRFAGVTVPQGAAIVSAYLQFEVDEETSVATDLTIRGQASDDAATFVKVDHDISSRPVGEQAVDWSPPPWMTGGEAGPDQQTPDLSAVLQEIVNRPGWSSGNALALIVGGTGERIAESSDGSGAPVLHLVYRTDEAPPNLPPSADAGADQTVLGNPSAAVSLDGSGSSDDGGLASLTYAWQQVSGPAGAILHATRTRWW